MFILTCPACQHRLKVKFARIGAMAQCPSCKHKFTVDQKSLMAVQEAAAPTATSSSGSAAGVRPVPPAAEGRPTPRPQPQPQSQPRPSSPTARPAQPAPASHAGRPQRPSAPQQAARHAAAPPPPPADELSQLAAATRRPVKKKKSGGFSVKLLAALLILCITLGTVLFLLVYSMKTGWTPTQRQVLVDKDGKPIDPAVLKKRQDDAAAADAAMLAAQNSTDPATRVNMSPNSPGLPASPGGAAAAAPPRAPGIKVALQPLGFSAAQWTAINPPTTPMAPLNTGDLMIWTPRLEREGDATMFVVNYLDDVEKVFETGYLQAQLTDGSGRAIAEFKQAVPALTPRAGVQVRVGVPKELADQAKGVVADLMPMDEVAGGAAIQLDEASPEVVGGSSGAPVIELGVYNPHTFAVHSANVIIEVLGEEGEVLGVWGGKVNAKIEPNQAATIRIEPQLPAGANPARVTLRGYAIKA